MAINEWIASQCKNLDSIDLMHELHDNHAICPWLYKLCPKCQEDIIGRYEIARIPHDINCETCGYTYAQHLKDKKKC